MPRQQKRRHQKRLLKSEHVEDQAGGNTNGKITNCDLEDSAAQSIRSGGNHTEHPVLTLSTSADLHCVPSSEGHSPDQARMFPVKGATVLVYSLDAQPHLNGLRGKVVGHEGQDILVDFGPPHAVVALSREYVTEASGPKFEGLEAVEFLKPHYQLMARLPVGCTLSLPAGEWPCGSMSIDSECQIHGVAGVGAPHTCVRGQFVISLRDASDVVVMANLRLCMPGIGNTIWCKRGSLRLENCTISSCGVGIGVDGHEHSSSVVFQACRFENCNQGAVVVGGRGALASLMGCHIASNRAGGLEVREGASSTVDNCTFQGNGRQAIVQWCKAGRISVANCTFSDHQEESTILIADGSEAIITECKISGSRAAAIAVEKSAAKISKCCCEDNLYGLLVQTGKCNVSVEGCSFRRNREHGIFIGYDACGLISISDTMLEENRRRGLENCSRRKSCIVELTANTLQKNGHDGQDIQYKLAKEVAKHVPLSQEMVSAARDRLCTQEQERTGVGKFLGVDELQGLSKMRTEKARKQAGLKHGLPHCVGCNRQEPVGEQFSKCSNCLSVRYCSRECQKQHWRVHKSYCKKLEKYPMFSDPSKSVVGSPSTKSASKAEVSKLQFVCGQRVHMACPEDSDQIDQGTVIGLRAGSDYKRVFVDISHHGRLILRPEQLCVVHVDSPLTSSPPNTPDYQCIDFPESFERPWKFFVGQIVEGWPHGRGLLVFRDGGMHVGEFIHKDAHGAGMHYYPMFMPKNVLGTWVGNKPHSAAFQWKGASANLCRFRGGSAYGVGISDGDLMSFNSRPPVQMQLPEGCPSLLDAMKNEVLEASDLVRSVLQQCSFHAYQHTVEALELLDEALVKLRAVAPS